MSIENYEDDLVLITAPMLSFSGAGWLHMYEFGCAKALLDLGLFPCITLASKATDSSSSRSGVIEQYFLQPERQIHCAGASGGALVSAAMLLGCDLDEIKEFALGICSRSRAKRPFSAIHWKKFIDEGFVRFGVEVMERDLERHCRVLSDRLHVFVTTVAGWHPRVVRSFNRSEDLHEALRASSLLPPFAGLPFTLSGGERRLVLDGGLSAFQPYSQTSTLMPQWMANIVSSTKPNTEARVEEWATREIAVGGQCAVPREEPLRRFAAVGPVIRISPFAFPIAEISPSIPIPALSWTVMPPPEKAYGRLFDLGYQDTLTYFLDHPGALFCDLNADDEKVPASTTGAALQQRVSMELKEKAARLLEKTMKSTGAVTQADLVGDWQRRFGKVLPQSIVDKAVWWLS